MEYLLLAILAPLSRLIFSDFRHRKVPVVWLGILAAGTVCIPIIQDGWREVLIRSGRNMLLVLYLSTGVVLWSWLKARRVVNPINLYIGLGDIVFFLILVPLFPFMQFAYLIVGCMLFSLIWWWWCSLLGRRKPENVPLIATSSIVVGATVVYKVFFE